ncbi:MAG: hypothetical protein FWE69_05545, partial [Clostridiales bacterium]|nr:hypothetical protein [Clostridiales bacterium]
MKKTAKLLSVILVAALLAALLPAMAYAEPTPLAIDLTGGQDADCFVGLESKVTQRTFAVTSGGATNNRTYEGVLLSDLLESMGMFLPAKVEYLTGDATPRTGEFTFADFDDLLLACRRV